MMDSVLHIGVGIYRLVLVDLMAGWVWFRVTDRAVLARRAL
jgi:hypothetical protein